MSGIVIGGSAANVDTTAQALFTGNVKDNSVNLFIFPPKQHVQQVVRPYYYNFTEDLANKMAGGDPYDAVTNLAAASDAIKSSVLPTHDGQVVDTYSLDSYYSFILIIDSRSSSANMLDSGGPSKRSIMIGYFLEEPHSPLDQTVINPNARLIFTHVDMASSSQSYGPNGVSNEFVMLGSDDIVHQMMDANFAPSMSLCDYSSIAYAHNRDTYTNALVRNSNPITLAELDKRAAHIPETLKSPKNHLVGIAEAAQQAWQAVGDLSIDTPVSAELGSGEDMFSNASSVMMGRMQKRGINHSLMQLIDPTQPAYLSQLNALWPDMYVWPCREENTPTFDLADPLSLSPESILSSMVSNTVSSYCRLNMITSIQFRYNSWYTSPDGMHKGQWDIKNISTTLQGDNPNNVKHQANQFRLLMESGLFPILEAHVGEFDVMVSFDGTGDTSVCLNSLDNGRIRNEFVVSHNRLGGMINPTVGSFDALSTNQNQLTGLFNGVVNSVVGQSELHSPFENYGYTPDMELASDGSQYHGGGDTTFF